MKDSGRDYELLVRPDRPLITMVREIVRAGSDCWTSTRRGDRLECLLVPVADAVAAFGSGAVAVCLGDGLGGASSVGAAVAGDHDLGIELFVA